MMLGGRSKIKTKTKEIKSKYQDFLKKLSTHRLSYFLKLLFLLTLLYPLTFPERHDSLSEERRQGRTARMAVRGVRPHGCGLKPTRPPE
jgi:hypothetical protein